MDYTQKEIREAHKKVAADIENGLKHQRELALAMVIQERCLQHLISIMEPEDKTQEERDKEESEAVDKEEQAKE